MFKKVFVAAIVIAFCLTLISCANDKKKNKFRGRRPKANCHMKELQDCIEKVDRYTNDSQSYKLITSSRGIDEICSNSLEGVNCFKDHMEKCGTPIQKEMFEFVLDQFSKSIDRFCKPGELRTEFLRHSPCIAENVLGKDEYKTKCNQPYQASIDKVNKHEDFDDRLDLTCCSYNRWQNCLLEMTAEKCQGAGREAMNNFMEKAFTGLSDMVCKQDDFLFSSDRCKALYPAAGTLVDPKKSTNPITKHLTSYFRFLVTS
ncbi:uncharacterized protein LOC107366215 [Tetranychus urticae]|uniref:DUF19 domain-containing protein n=1 Tax=Tetranychus urticae TaxID=32264 RepID=T1KPX5_TETUR|nr:uncharacterized protein LOC107366215 [Tetranychus urticae]